MTETETITITKARFHQMTQDTDAAWHLRDNLSYLSGLFSDIPEVQKQIQKALDAHKKAKEVK